MEYLLSQGIQPEIVNSKIRLTPSGKVTSEIREYTRAHKAKIIEQLKNQNRGCLSTKDECVCAPGAPAPAPAPAAPTLCQFDYTSGCYMHTLYNRLRRRFRQEPDNAPLFQELEQLMERIDEHWGHQQFEHGWYYG